MTCTFFGLRTTCLCAAVRLMVHCIFWVIASGSRATLIPSPEMVAEGQNLHIVCVRRQIRERKRVSRVVVQRCRRLQERLVQLLLGRQCRGGGGGGRCARDLEEAILSSIPAAELLFHRPLRFDPRQREFPRHLFVDRPAPPLAGTTLAVATKHPFTPASAARWCVAPGNIRTCACRHALVNAMTLIWEAATTGHVSRESSSDLNAAAPR